MRLQSPTGDLLEIAGPARVGTLVTDTVLFFQPSTGLVVDTRKSDPCSVSYFQLDRGGISAIVHCSGHLAGKLYHVTGSVTGHYIDG
jgi:hypothetical protein